MFNTVEQYDRVVLFGGDGDFERTESNYYAQKYPLNTVVSTEGIVTENCGMLLTDILI